MLRPMRVEMLSREYPPHIYGGAGVHVSELARVLHGLPGVDVHVRAFDGPRGDLPEGEVPVSGYAAPPELASANAALRTLGVDLAIAADVAELGSDDLLIHSHTWYANLAGHLSAQLTGAPHVLTAHSLEPLRPWKAEQLGGGYRVSSWAEATSYAHADGIIAVSAGMRADILRSYDLDPARVHVVHNGIDLDGWRAPREDEREASAATVQRLDIAPDRPTVVFVGRITRQKGLPHLLRAARLLPDDVQLVLCAGAPDTPEIAQEVTGLVEELRQVRTAPVLWIDEMLPRHELVAVLDAATVFVCPSVYEPLGIVNLEAMAVGLPVVGTATGGIPEVVEDGVTGLLVPIEQHTDGTGTPTDPDRFEADLAQALTEVVADTATAEQMGRASRRRVEDHFSWQAVAERTLEVYRAVLG
ncbi:glycogen synthase (ADP-glucose) [Bogoriella caseilytica]|uniref:D-inositol 3-phosphate glycosyltransferase n=2 Tax=Bogoriella caseilytica TaxID=56055 RepID=A0A3N2BG80_9MICO|nr:glycogen synthase (ADP-glucose) [Bogoriella caseilytica]